MRFFLLRFALLTALAGVSAPQAGAAPATPDQRALIAANVPREAYATPARPRRLLIYTETKGFRHASIEVGVEAITLMGQTTGAYTATAAATPDVFTAENLKGYDAVLFLNTTGNLFEQVETQQVLLDFVNNGGGIAGIHSATDTCYTWPEWGKMMGGYFDGHPWTADFHVTLAIEDPAHPLNAAFGGATSFFVQDEIYQLKAPYSRQTHRVLTRLDPRRAQFDHPDIERGLKRTDQDFAITQIREYGKGRVFYCALGHNHHIYWNPKVMGHYLAGLQWVMGDLKADATPKPMAPLAPLATDDALYETVARTGFTDTQLPFQWLDDAIAEVGLNAGALADIERRLVAILQSPESTPAARQAVAVRLGRIIPANPPARHPALGALTPLLLAKDATDVDLARAALEPVSGRQVDALFVSALKQASGAPRLALIQAVGQRRQRSAVPVLASLLNGPDADVAAAAAQALGAIGDGKAVSALRKSSSPAGAAARLEAANRMEGRAALRIYRELEADSKVSDAVRLGAFRSLIAAEPAKATERVVAAITGNDAARRAVALEAVSSLPAKSIVPALAGQFASLPPATQIAVLAAFGELGDAAAVPTVLAALDSTDTAVRLAALTALGRLPGDATVVTTLARVAGGTGELARTASTSLSQLRGPAVDDAVRAGASTGEAALRPVLVRHLALRGMTESLPYLLSLRTETDVAVRLAALEALDVMAPASEQAALLAWALDATDNAERNRAVRSLISVTLRNDAVAVRTQPILDALAARGRDAQLLVIPALLRLTDAPVVVALAQYARAADSAVARAALDVLSRWPDDGAVRALVALAEEPSTSPEARATAAQAATRQFERVEAWPKAEESALLSRLLAVTTDRDRAKHLLWLLSRCADEPALATARRYEAQPDLAADARDAIAAIESNQKGPPVFAASAAANRTALIVDGKTDTAWTVGANAQQWLRLDLHRERPIRRITLNQGSRRNEWPETYAVHVTNDPQTPGEPRVEGRGTRDQTVITFPAGTRGRYVIIRQTSGREENPAWSVAGIKIE